MKRFKYLLLAGLAVMTILGGCSNNDSTQKKTTEITVADKETSAAKVTTAATTAAATEASQETTPEETEAEIPEGMVRSYLTGELIDEELASQRPIAVMLSNVKVAVPQSGIGQASVIFECPVEALYTRLMAVYENWEDLEKIGSVRSARTNFVVKQYEFDSIFCHYGQSTYAVGYIENPVLCNNLNGVTGIGGTVYYRTTDRSAPHNAYASAEGIKAGIETKGYETQHSEDYTGTFNFVDLGETADMSNGAVATYVEPGIKYNTPYFVYNEEDGLYYRYQFGDAQCDDLTDEQLSVKNVIIQYAYYEPYDDTSYLYFYLCGEGEGKYITDGKAIDITWSKPDDYQITQYFDEEGNEVEINEGKSWIIVVPTENIELTNIGAIEDYKQDLAGYTE